MKNIALLTVVVLAIAAACVQPEQGAQRGQDQMTIAKVQREIKIGMSSSEVVEVLGSPNMVTTDSERRETWVYDRVSTEVSSSQSQAGVWRLVAGAGSSTATRSQSQKTLTIIVKFDENAKVRDFAYRTSSF
jgi:outer membrane protein assembly factor BamE (lipoprotein component of BamABCDE complex)